MRAGITRKIMDGGVAELRARCAKLQGDKVLVGIPAGKTEDNGVSVAMIGAVHEYGVPELNIPERSWLRGGIRNHKKDLIAVAKNDLKKVLDKKMTVETALARLGKAGAAAAQMEIRHGDFVPNTPETIARKGSSHPLMDTGTMLQSVTSVVVRK